MRRVWGTFRRKVKYYENIQYGISIYLCISEILHIYLTNLQLKAFSVGLKIPQAIRFPLVLRNPGSNCLKLPLKPSEVDKEEMQEVSASLARAEGISKDAAVAPVLSK